MRKVVQRPDDSKGSFIRLLDKQERAKGSLSSFTQDSDDDSSIEYIKEAIPGPGAYDVSNLSFGSKRGFGKSQNKGFGITEKRFTDPKPYYAENENEQNSIRKVVRRSGAGINLAFGRSHEEPVKTEEEFKKLGPGYYP